MVLPDEEWSQGSDGETAFGVEGEKFGYTGLSDVVEGDDPGLSGFGEVGREVEFVSWEPVVSDQVDGEFGCFPDS